MPKKDIQKFESEEDIENLDDLIRARFGSLENYLRIMQGLGKEDYTVVRKALPPGIKGAYDLPKDPITKKVQYWKLGRPPLPDQPEPLYISKDLPNTEDVAVTAHEGGHLADAFLKGIPFTVDHHEGIPKGEFAKTEAQRIKDKADELESLYNEERKQDIEDKKVALGRGVSTELPIETKMEILKRIRDGQ